MIHLDTNYLIGLLIKDSVVAKDVDRWLASGEFFAASSVTWTEFLNGPVFFDDVKRVESVLQSRIMPFGKAEAALAAELFNQTGRKRGSRFDCLIASTAIISQAALATANQPDFRPFIPYGLKLAIVSSVPPGN